MAPVGHKAESKVVDRQSALFDARELLGIYIQGIVAQFVEHNMGTYLVDVDMAGGKKLGSGNVFLIINDMAVAYNERLDGEVECALGLRIFGGQ